MRCLVVRRWLVALLLPALLVVQPFARPAQAQQGTPAAGAVAPVEAVAGVTNPRGMAWDDAGVLHVALAGRGGASAGVLQVEGGCAAPLAQGLGSIGVYAQESYTGVADIAFLDGRLYALVSALGAPAGIYRIEPDGATALVADLEAWHRANPTAGRPPDYTPGGIWHGLAAAEGRLWATDSNSGQVVGIAPDGAIARIADLSDVDPIPTGVVAAPDGGVYVAYLTGVPYAAGAAKVVRVTADGAVSDAWTGLTAATDVAVGPDGTLYATEMATNTSAEPPYVAAGTGRVVRQTATGLEVVAAGLDYPIAVAFGPDGGLYAAGPALFGEEGQGEILRVGGSETAATPVTGLCRA